MFLGIILNMIVFSLFILSVMLLYNLLLVSVETKTFEMGVLRVLGLNKTGVTSLIFVQSLTFVVPGLVLGIAMSFPLLVIASDEIYNAIGV